MKLPSLDSFSERRAVLKSERNKRLEAIKPLKNECAEIRLRLQSGGEPNMGNADEVRLRALLGHDPIALVLPDPQRLNELLIKLNTLNAEISALDAEILKDTREASNKLIEHIKSDIDRLGSKFANAFRDLHAAHLEYERFIDSVEDVGANVGQFRIKPNGLSHPMDRSSNYYYGLLEFTEAGFFSKSDMPKVFKQ